ncbi:hypothetical protein [Pseudanabaena sp. PCC 6802]|uniref:hypothetical protein n=1 Tax=Pseudanabaena sp. PCC 6802 TaxID=118173 RepID=UPI000347005E|nr:hypothetical protein [Pseudanabaena sp. PCC 6802]
MKEFKVLGWLSYDGRTYQPGDKVEMPEELAMTMSGTLDVPPEKPDTKPSVKSKEPAPVESK